MVIAPRESVGDDWDGAFDAMLEAAASKGRLTDDGAEIQAHVELARA